MNTHSPTIRPLLRRIFRLALLAVLLPLAHALDWTGLEPVGSLRSFSKTDKGLALACSDGSAVELSVLAPDLVRVRTKFAGQDLGRDHSWAVERTEWTPVSFTVTEKPEALVLATAQLEVVLHRTPFLVEFREPGTGRIINADARPMARDPKTGRVAAAKRLGLDEHFYGLGEKAARLDRRRGRFEMWNSDTPGYVEGTDPIYQSIPFYTGWEGGAAYGLFYDNSHRSLFDMGNSGQEYAGFTAQGGTIDYYFFQGPSLKKILGRYTELTGRMPMPPLWALGNQQSRYSYYPDSMLEQVAAEYRKRDLPLDVLYLDIHYMNGYRVFTWDPQRFPNPAALTAKLGAQGVQVVTIIDPGVKYQPLPEGAKVPEKKGPAELGAQEPSYYVFNEGLKNDFFLRRQNGSLYIGEVWPGKSVFVDYTKAEARRWWGDLHKALLDQGIAGVWTDMNEPSDFVDKSGATQTDVVFDDLGAKSLYGKQRNLFALNMARATYEGLERLRPDRRPFVITRAGYAGVQRYSTVWTGDNNATFESLALNIPMFASLGLSGETFVGSDVPGFIGRGDGELLARSYELAFLVPLCRNHGEVNGYDHEPWRYGSTYEAIVRKYLKLRYRLLPFLYTTLEEAHRTGVPLFRPLLLNYQDDPDTLEMNDQFMVGSDLLAAPVVRAAQREREVYLPKGEWYDFWTGTKIAGGAMLSVKVPLDHVPLYVRAGAILPSTEAMSHVSEKPWNPLRLDVYPDSTGAAAGSLYEDDGLSPDYRKGVFRRSAFGYRREAGKSSFVLSAPEGSHKTPARNFEIAIHQPGSVASVETDGRALPKLGISGSGEGWWMDEQGVLHVRIKDEARAQTLSLR